MNPSVAPLSEKTLRRLKKIKISFLVALLLGGIFSVTYYYLSFIKPYKQIKEHGSSIVTNFLEKNTTTLGYFTPKKEYRDPQQIQKDLEALNTLFVDSHKEYFIDTTKRPEVVQYFTTLLNFVFTHNNSVKLIEKAQESKQGTSSVAFLAITPKRTMLIWNIEGRFGAVDFVAQEDGTQKLDALSPVYFCEKRNLSLSQEKKPTLPCKNFPAFIQQIAYEKEGAVPQ